MTRITLTILAALSCAALSGCLATFSDRFENGIYCSVAGDKLVMVSELGMGSGISMRVREQDRKVICREPAAAAPAAAASGAK